MTYLYYLLNSASIISYIINNNMPATVQATLAGAQRDDLVRIQFQLGRPWTKPQLVAATNMSYMRITDSINRLVASGEVVRVIDQEFGGPLGSTAAIYMLAGI